MPHLWMRIGLTLSLRDMFTIARIDSPTRYDLARFAELVPDALTFDFLTSGFCRQIPLLPQGGSYQVRDDVARPDLASYRIYGDTQYWWILLVYNKMISPAELLQGAVISYPSVSSIEQLFYTLSTQ